MYSQAAHLPQSSQEKPQLLQRTVFFSRCEPHLTLHLWCHAPEDTGISQLLSQVIGRQHIKLDLRLLTDLVSQGTANMHRRGGSSVTSEKELHTCFPSVQRMTETTVHKVPVKRERQSSKHHPSSLLSLLKANSKKLNQAKHTMLLIKIMRIKRQLQGQHCGAIG